MRKIDVLTDKMLAIPTDNIWRVFDTCKAYGQYPLDIDGITTRIEELRVQGAGLNWDVEQLEPQKEPQAARRRRPRPRRQAR